MKKGIFAILALLAVFAMVTAGCPDSGSSSGNNSTLPTSFTVTFDKNNTDPESTDPNPTTRTTSITNGTGTVILPTAPNRPGYIFDGYNTQADGKGTVFDRSTPVKKDITVYAQWKKGFRVTFDKNNNEARAPVPAYKDVFPPAEVVDALATIEPLDSYTFKGWNTKQDGTGTAFITVYAQWELVKNRAEIKYGSPVIGSGVIDPLWNDATLATYPIEKIYATDSYTAYRNNPDTKGGGRALWDDNGLTVFVVVADPNVTTGTGTPHV